MENLSLKAVIYLSPTKYTRHQEGICQTKVNPQQEPDEELSQESHQRTSSEPENVGVRVESSAPLKATNNEISHTNI